MFVMGDNRANSADSRYHQDDGNRRTWFPSPMWSESESRNTGRFDRLGAIDDHHEVFKDVSDAFRLEFLSFFEPCESLN